MSTRLFFSPLYLYYSHCSQWWITTKPTDNQSPMVRVESPYLSGIITTDVFQFLQRICWIHFVLTSEKRMQQIDRKEAFRRPSQTTKRLTQQQQQQQRLQLVSVRSHRFYKRHTTPVPRSIGVERNVDTQGADVQKLQEAVFQLFKNGGGTFTWPCKNHDQSQPQNCTTVELCFW